MLLERNAKRQVQGQFNLGPWAVFLQRQDPDQALVEGAFEVAVAGVEFDELLGLDLEVVQDVDIGRLAERGGGVERIEGVLVAVVFREGGHSEGVDCVRAEIPEGFKRVAGG